LKDADEEIECEQGNLFVFDSIKWYTDEPSITKFLNELNALGSENYLLVEVCSEYPNLDYVGEGSWNDNPFDLNYQISAVLAYS